MKIFFDFDGTLAETMHRDYSVYRSSLPDSKSLDFDSYVSLRRRKTNIDEILSMTHPSYAKFKGEFLKKREALMEMPDYLQYDAVLQGVHESLSQISLDHFCYVLSARRDENLLRKQCERMNLSRYFQEIIAVSAPERKGSVISAIKGEDFSVMVGDTENDIRAARESGSISVAVTTGIRDRKTISDYCPDHVIINLGELVYIINHARQQQRE